MTEPAPHNDFASFPAPDEGILVTLFLTVRKVARSRDFYSRILGGTVILDENPCTVRLANSWIIMNPGGPPTPDKPGISVVDYQPGDTAQHGRPPRPRGHLGRYRRHDQHHRSRCQRPRWPGRPCDRFPRQGGSPVGRDDARR